MNRTETSEVRMFLHCHLRGYDKHGNGIHQDNVYFDRYGAPVTENLWEEGYHCVEEKIVDFCKTIEEYKLEFSEIAGIGGGVHLYKSLHAIEPWNWTGWVPRQAYWYQGKTHHSNRKYPTLRGNEIQNNLWDYDPESVPDEDAEPDELWVSQQPRDPYRGGYWYYGEPFARYLHIISLKDIDSDKTGKSKRYNYIVHPLAYRAVIHTIPDNSVDAMQWCIIYMPQEPHFGKDEPWGEKCHGLEIFNDFTYYYSNLPPEDIDVVNGGKCVDDNGNTYYLWHDTYPLEFAVFLLDSALARGVYYHTICANDAFYEMRDDFAHDPKGSILKKKKCGVKPILQLQRRSHSRHNLVVPRLLQMVEVLGVRPYLYKDNIKALEFLSTKPYKANTAFGNVAVLDDGKLIANAIKKIHLEDAETMIMDRLREGSYYSTTGLGELFAYNDRAVLPYKITGQESNNKMCYDITEDMALEFTFLECREEMAHLIWRFTIMIKTGDDKYETNHGYFMLDPKNKTVLDLEEYAKPKSIKPIKTIKCVYFTAISPRNPQHRAWFHAIRGPAFGDPYYHATMKLTHNVVGMKKERNRFTVGKSIKPTAVKMEESDLDFYLGKHKQANDMFVYFMQVKPHQQDTGMEATKQSSEFIPPRILQSVHGYFRLEAEVDTRLKLDGSWDKETVKDGTVYFYRIDGTTCEVHPMDSKPTIVNYCCIQ